MRRRAVSATNSTAPIPGRARLTSNADVRGIPDALANARKLIAAGNVAAAADYAVYQLRSRPLAKEVVETAIRRNSMGSLNTQTLYVLA